VTHILALSVLALLLVGCGSGGGGSSSSNDGGSTTPTVTMSVVSGSVSYGVCSTPDDLTTYTARAVVSDEASFASTETVYVRAQFAPGVSIIDTPRAVFSFYLDPVGGPAATTPVYASNTLRFWTVGSMRTTFYVKLGDPLAAGTYRVRAVITPVDGFPAGTAPQALQLPYVIAVAPVFPG